MPMSDARKRANKKWNDANLKTRYDRVQLVVPAGVKNLLEDAAASSGQSLNMFVQTAIMQHMGLTSWPTNSDD